MDFHYSTRQPVLSSYEPKWSQPSTVHLRETRKRCSSGGNSDRAELHYHPHGPIPSTKRPKTDTFQDDLSEFLDFTGVYEPVWDELSPSPFLGRPGSSSSSFSATDSSSFGSFSTVDTSSGRSHPDYSSPNYSNPNYRARAFVDSPPVDFSAFDFPGSPPNTLTSWHSATPYGLAPDSMYDGLAVGVDARVEVRDWWQTECGIGRLDGSEITSAYPDDRLISEAVRHEAQPIRSSYSVPSHAILPGTHATEPCDRVLAAIPKRVTRRPRPTFIPLPSPVHRCQSDPPSHPANPPDFAAAVERIQTQEDRGFRLVLPSFAPRR